MRVKQGNLLESQLELSVKHKHTVRILQITDTHLFANVEDTLLGINTYRSYHAVLNAIREQDLDVDLIVATGDLVQDQTFEAYQHFADGIATLTPPCVWLPGNHDYQPAMIDALNQAGILSAKQVLIGDNWQMLLLDSQIQGVPHGELSDCQLDWLTRCLESEKHRDTIILLHHHPMPSGCTWLDQHSLRNSQELAERLRDHSQVKMMLCGHIHQEMDEMWNGIRLLATPSTCIQFRPHCTNFTLDTVSPGWRYLEMSLLSDDKGDIETQVYRLAGTEFCPDLDADGY